MDFSVLVLLVVSPQAIFHDHHGNLIAVVNLIQTPAQALGVDLPAPIGNLQIRVLGPAQQVPGSDLHIGVGGHTEGHVIAEGVEVHRTVP